jgi:hypothetical protein
MNQSERLEILELAKSLIEENTEPDEIHDAIFGPNGAATLACNDRAEREAFSETPESKEIRALMQQQRENENK